MCKREILKCFSVLLINSSNATSIKPNKEERILPINGIFIITLSNFEKEKSSELFI
jgi:hypothetical protein